MVKGYKRRKPITIIPVGAGLARDSDAALCQVKRTDTIAGKPAPTGMSVQPRPERLRGMSGKQTNMHPQPAAVVLCPQTATLQPQGIARNTQAQTKAAIAGTRAIKAGKRRKDPLQFFRCHTCALVIEPQVPHIAFAPAIKADDTLGW